MNADLDKLPTHQKIEVIALCANKRRVSRRVIRVMKKYQSDRREAVGVIGAMFERAEMRQSFTAVRNIPEILHKALDTIKIIQLRYAMTHWKRQDRLKTIA